MVNPQRTERGNRTIGSKKKDLQQTIKQDKAAINQLENLDSLEAYARENFGHKRKDETIFIVED